MKYQVIESRVWIHTTGRRVSIYGASPWTSPADKPNWSIHSEGWTVRNPLTGEVGACRTPWATREAAQLWADHAGHCSNICIGD